MRDTDRDLVRSFQQGDVSAYGEIYRRYKAHAVRLCLRYLGNPEDAEEAAQETMLRVFRALSRFNGEYALKAWVERIAINISLDAIRQRSRRPKAGADHAGETPIEEISENGGDNSNPSDLVEALMEYEEVRAALKALPEHHRAALILREFEGRSHEEIATYLGISAAGAKALIHRAKRSFRRIWNGSRPSSLRVVLAPFLSAGRFLQHLGRAPQVVAGEASAGGSSAAVAQAPAVERIAASVVAVVAAGAMGVATVKAPGPLSSPVPVATEAIPAVSGAAEVSGPFLMGEHSIDWNVLEAIAGDEGEPLGDEGALSSESEAEMVDDSGTEGELDSEVAEETDSEQVPAETDSTEPESDPAAEAPSGEPPQPGSDQPQSPEASEPQPSWDFAFRAAYSFLERCGCQEPAKRVSSSARGTPGQKVSFGESLDAPLYDSQGEAGWPASLGYWGSADGSSGKVVVRFLLSTSKGRFGYEGTGPLAELRSESQEKYTYVFKGAYRLVEGRGENAPMPNGGFDLELGWWTKGPSLLGGSLWLRP